MATVVGIGLYVATGHELSASVVFPALIVYSDLPMPFLILKDVINVIAKTMASAERLVRFFSLGELPPRVAAEDSRVQAIDLGVKFDGKAILDKISFLVKPGGSLGMVGSVGSGKTTLLEALLGELPLSGGSGEAGAGLAFVNEEAFVMNATVRANIEFGGPALSDRELAGGRAHGFEPDLAAMPSGLETEIGEHGVNLSGGQKQRLALARAVAQNSAVVLLDDPLSALDVKTEHFICDNLIFGHWKKTTRICSTHRLSPLSRFDQVLFLREGRVAAIGTYAELIAGSSGFREFLESERHHEQERAPAGSSLATLTDAPGQGGFTVAEDRRRGRVKGGVYQAFLRAMGGEGVKH